MEFDNLQSVTSSVSDNLPFEAISITGRDCFWDGLKTGDLEPGRFKPIEEQGAEEKDPVVFTGLETVWVIVDKVGIPTFGLSYRIPSWLVLFRRFYLTLRSQCLLIWLPFLPGFLLWKLAIGSLFPLLVSLNRRYGRTR
jgi:hypothetical protein